MRSATAQYETTRAGVAVGGVVGAAVGAVVGGAVGAGVAVGTGGTGGLTAAAAGVGGAGGAVNAGAQPHVRTGPTNSAVARAPDGPHYLPATRHSPRTCRALGRSADTSRATPRRSRAVRARRGRSPRSHVP